MGSTSPLLATNDIVTNESELTPTPLSSLPEERGTEGVSCANGRTAGVIAVKIADSVAMWTSG
jgi:hypothetical protein